MKIEILFHLKLFHQMTLREQNKHEPLLMTTLTLVNIKGALYLEGRVSLWSGRGCFPFVRLSQRDKGNLYEREKNGLKRCAYNQGFSMAATQLTVFKQHFYVINFHECTCWIFSVCFSFCSHVIVHSLISFSLSDNISLISMVVSPGSTMCDFPAILAASILLRRSTSSRNSRIICQNCTKKSPSEKD